MYASEVCTRILLQCPRVCYSSPHMYGTVMPSCMLQQCSYVCSNSAHMYTVAVPICMLKYVSQQDVARWIQQLITVYPAYLATRNEDTKEALLRWRSLAAKQLCSAVVDELEWLQPTADTQATRCHRWRTTAFRMTGLG